MPWHSLTQQHCAHVRRTYDRKDKKVCLFLNFHLSFQFIYTLAARLFFRWYDNTVLDRLWNVKVVHEIVCSSAIKLIPYTHTSSFPLSLPLCCSVSLSLSLRLLFFESFASIALHYWKQYHAQNVWFDCVLRYSRAVFKIQPFSTFVLFCGFGLGYGGIQNVNQKERKKHEFFSKHYRARPKISLFHLYRMIS